MEWSGVEWSGVGWGGGGVRGGGRGGGRGRGRGGRRRGGGGGGSDGDTDDDVSDDTDAEDAPDYGDRVPVDTAPGPAPVCRALEIIAPSTRFMAGATVGARLSSPRRHLWNSHHLQNRSTRNWGISMVRKTMGNCLCATTWM